MSGIRFGIELKKIRKAVGIPSKVLSKKVNKAVTYVSQLERGLIKNPDFYTCKKILMELGFDETQATNNLNYFNIKSPEQEKAELDFAIKFSEESFEEEEWKNKNNYYTKKIEKISTKNEMVINKLENRLDAFVTHDLSRAEKVIFNLNGLLEDEEEFDFFCSLFEFNYSSLTQKEKSKLMSLLKEYVKTVNTNKIIDTPNNQEEQS